MLRYCVGRRSRELGLGKELMAHQEIEELGSLKLGLGSLVVISGNLVGNWVGEIDGWKRYSGVVG